jgi:hypothetical protein
MMRHAFTGIKLAIFLAVLSAGPGFAQSTSDEAISGATTVAPVAYVYVPTPHGIYAYKTSSAGMLTIIKGSPFTKTVGLSEATGSTSSHWAQTTCIRMRSPPMGLSGTKSQRSIRKITLAPNAAI